MTLTTLEIRNTRRYVGTYAGLDDWTPIGYVEVLSTSQVRDEKSIEEYTSTTLLLRIKDYEPAANEKEEAKIERIARALHDTYSRHGCAHEYDCCGCWSYSVVKIYRCVQVKNFTDESDELWCIQINSSRNY